MDPILKSNWERYADHIPIDIPLASKLISPYSKSKIQSIDLLPGGCVNTNYKVSFTDSYPPLVLRIYVRKDSTPHHESHIHTLVQRTLPAPKFIYNDTSLTLIEHPYAIIEFISGTALNKLILENNTTVISQCAYSAGTHLANLSNITFDVSGFFDSDLKIKKLHKEYEYQTFTQNCLKDNTVVQTLGNTLHKKVNNFINKNVAHIPETTNPTLVHGDYDPNNMLASQTNNQWQITSILDWEFSFSGSYLSDIGTMLRYAHKLPNCYESEFIRGFTSIKQLPENWKLQSQLMDLLNLLDFCRFNRPNMNKDVVSLIKHTLTSNE